ncbi:hypothetical protein ACFOY4_13590 [Actinomadura syzygii]|uniref:Exo-alpha-sialidase n=1 Tax=Actinomadura syzygii TaxID=1427538 RepID=A0A5D0U8E2_9ACTN|nr:sialidase family protein [Actinomadura syzygii]TYC13945.1 exo-alpha-sialidase [Actinomadura syzygii]
MTARTPEQDEAPRSADEGPGGSRRVRRRLTFGVAGDLADMPAALSPWQRAYEAWRAAGLSWGHGAPPREPAAARPRAPQERPAVPSAKPAGKPAAKPAAKARRKAAVSEPGDVLVAGPPRPPTPPLMRRLRFRAAIGVTLVLGAAFVVVAVSQGEDDAAPGRPGLPAPVEADALFAADPAAATDGLVQSLAAVAADAGTLVAAGTEGDPDPGRERPQFLVSADAGKTWSLARIRTQDGAMPPLGEIPSHVAGGGGRWMAVGRTPSGATVAWTSADAETWTRLQPSAAFKPTDRVNGLARTGGGFVAVGGTAAGRAVVWTSPDGQTWQRDESLTWIVGLDRVASSGGVVVAHGTYTRKVTTRKGRRKVTRTVRAEGLWRSADGGRTWTGVSVPQGQGSYGETRGLAAGPGGGFATVREGRRTTGPKKHRRTARFGVLFTSPDGQRWQAVSRFGGGGIERFGGAPSGLAVVARAAKGFTVLRSGDGRTWQPGGSVPAGVRTSAVTVASGGAVAVAGRQGDDAYLSGVDLRGVAGAVRAERAVRALAAGPGRVVAVGSTNGGAAIWSAPDGRAWTRAGFPATGGRLADVVHGPRGWLALGRTAASGPLAMTSQDGASWQKAAFPAGPAPLAVAAGPSGYVAVGARAAWRSSDLAAWRSARLDGVATAVTLAADKYVAVGGKGAGPAAWTSPDGRAWTPAKLPEGLTGRLTRVAARGGVLVAIGAGDAPLVSADGGTTWTPQVLGAGLVPTAVTATPGGFVAAAATPEGDAVVLASAEGVSWRRLQVPGLSGRGDRRLTALTAMDAGVLATGTTTDGGRTEAPMLWQARIPG